MMDLEIETGTHWKCKACGHVQEPVDDEEWPYHCDTIMSMTSWYRIVEAGTGR